ncbi:MAG: nucleoside recognition domain-containing protein [Cytophagaceae bacterium]
MFLTYVWIAFFTLSFIVVLAKTIIFHDLEAFPLVIKALFDMTTTAFTISIELTGMLTFWMGLMLVAEKSGIIHRFSSVISPFFSKLFPEIPANHPVMGNMMMNFSANMLGLDNAATPLGLKAMQGLQELNPMKEVASNAQIMFLVLNTSGLTLIPVNIMLFRNQLGAADPSDVFLPILITTFVSTLAGLIAVSIKQKINLLQPIILTSLVTAVLTITLFVWLLMAWFPSQFGQISSLIGNFFLFAVILLFMWYAWYKKVVVFDVFIEGAKDGFNVAVKIIPYMVGLLTAIAVFKSSGIFEFLIQQVQQAGGNGYISDVVKAIPTALMKPLSGSGARAMMLDTMTQYGADSVPGRLACVFQGSVDTTFYIVAVYFGSVGVKMTRYAITCGLIADAASIIAAITVVSFWQF